MDFQELVDAQGMAAAVLSVEKLDDDHWGEIRIVRANAQYKSIMGPKYHDDMLYDDLIPKEPKFEDFCYRAAVNKQHIHAYVDTRAMGVWTDSTYIPLSPSVDKGNICHFLFYFEFTKIAESDKMSDVSLETATAVIQTCINLRGSKNFYESMNTVIEDIQKTTESFSSVIIMIDGKQKKYAPLCAKFRDDVAKIDDFMPYLTPEVVLSWEDTLKNHDNLIINSDTDMDELEKINPVWVKSLRGANVKNLILIPLSRDNKMFGVLFITNFNGEKIVELKEYVELTGFFLSSEIASNDLMEKLEYMSNIDTLTGVRNRNSMNARIDRHVNKSSLIRTPFGVIFADLNGLKQCNDKDGHEAGDKLLINAAEVLKKHFGNDEIYRSGGDEFVIIVQDCDKEIFKQRIEGLRAETGYDSNVSLAIGSDWSSEEEDLRKCMHIADEAMYADKNDFYKQHPEKARR